MERWSWGPGHVWKDPKRGRAQAQPESSEDGECGRCQPPPPSDMYTSQPQASRQTCASSMICCIVPLMS